MPSVHLRLTEEELAQLQAWAKDGHRSLQKEMVYRLFRERSRNLEAPKPPVPIKVVEQPAAAALSEPGSEQPSHMARGSAEKEQPDRRATTSDRSPGSESDAHFKPDPKPTAKPKRTGFRKS